MGHWAIKETNGQTAQQPNGNKGGIVPHPRPTTPHSSLCDCCYGVDISRTHVSGFMIYLSVVHFFLSSSSSFPVAFSTLTSSSSSSFSSVASSALTSSSSFSFVAVVMALFFSYEALVCYRKYVGSLLDVVGHTFFVLL